MSAIVLSFRRKSPTPPAWDANPFACGQRTALGISCPTVVSVEPGVVYRISVIQQATAGILGVYDSREIGVGNQVIEYTRDYPPPSLIELHAWPLTRGLVIDPGVGGMVAVVYA